MPLAQLDAALAALLIGAALILALAAGVRQ